MFINECEVAWKTNVPAVRRVQFPALKRELLVTTTRWFYNIEGSILLRSI